MITLIVEGKLLVLGRHPMFVIMNAPVDSSSMILDKTWKNLVKYVQGSETAENILGVIMYFLDTLLLRFFEESHSTVMMICKKMLK